jgi:outer membrane protein TolC
MCMHNRNFRIIIVCLAFILSSLIARADSPLTMDEAIRIGLAQSPSLDAARLESRAGQVEIDREKPVFSPKVTAKAETTLQGPTVTFPRDNSGLDTVQKESFSRVQLRLDQPLYTPGFSAAAKRYHARTMANRWGYLQQVNDAILSIRLAYIQALSAQAMLKVAQEENDLARKHLDLARLMLQSGNVSEEDVKSAESDAARAESGLTQATDGVQLAIANLNRLMGRDPVTPAVLVAPTKLPVIPEDTKDGIQEALSNRPEMRMIDEDIAAAKAGITLASSQSLPGLSAQAVVAHQTPSAFVNENYYAASLVIKWDIFDGGKTHADEESAKLQSLRLKALRTETELGIRTETLKSWKDMQDAASRIQSCDKQVAAARAALDIANIRFQQRAATQLEVSSAMLNLIKAETDKNNAIYDLFSAYANWRHATGEDVMQMRGEQTQTGAPMSDKK